MGPFQVGHGMATKEHPFVDEGTAKRKIEASTQERNYFCFEPRVFTEEKRNAGHANGGVFF